MLQTNHTTFAVTGRSFFLASPWDLADVPNGLEIRTQTNQPRHSKCKKLRT